MDTKISVQALHYISKSYNISNVTNKMGALKLLFFAEKYHLQKYGRMITNDTFFAMKNGPVASAARDILGFDDMNFHSTYVNEYIRSVNKNNYTTSDVAEKELDMLSKTDIEALQFALDNFGHLDEWALVEETHKYKEWKRYEKLFAHEVTRRQDVIIEDFFLNTGEKEDPFLNLNSSIVELSKNFYLNT